MQPFNRTQSGSSKWTESIQSAFILMMHTVHQTSTHSCTDGGFYPSCQPFHRYGPLYEGVGIELAMFRMISDSSTAWTTIAPLPVYYHVVKIIRHGRNAKHCHTYSSIWMERCVYVLDEIHKRERWLIVGEQLIIQYTNINNTSNSLLTILGTDINPQPTGLYMRHWGKECTKLTSKKHHPFEK